MHAIVRLWHGRASRQLRLAATILGAAVGVVAWLALAPAALGGSSTYVTTYGTSMEPTLHRGDLAIVRPQTSYRVGEVVAYNSASLHRVVLHRIIGRDGDRFVFKGDNNTWTDVDHPRPGALVGKMEMRLPGVGTQVQRAASPPGIAVLAGIVVLPVGARGRRRRGTTGTDAAAKAALAAPRRRGPSWGPVDPRLLGATAIVAAIAAVALTRPTTIHTTSDLPFNDRGEFTYSGAAPGGAAVYQAEEVSSGQPVFLNLVDQLDVAYTYRADASVPLTASGVLSLGVVLSDTTGWTYPFSLARSVHFAGGEGARIEGTLDLAKLRATIAAMEAATGVQRDSYTVAISTSVHRQVKHGAGVTEGVFASDLKLRLDSLELHVASPGGDALAPSQGALLSVPLDRANHLELLGQALSIALLRALALAGLCLLAAVWAEWLLRTTRGDEASAIERRYRSYLVPVRTTGTATKPIHEVESIATLARLADHAGAPVLQSEDGVYQVIDGPRVFRYTADPVESRP